MTVEQAREVLKSNGYYVENLWHIDDVKGKFDCTDEQAMEVLNKSLENEATMEQVWYSIREFGDMNGLTEKEEEA